MAEQKDLDSTYMGVVLLHSRLSKAFEEAIRAFGIEIVTYSKSGGDYETYEVAS